MTAPITLYTAATPNGWKASITLEELGLAYHVTPINMQKMEQKEPWFLKINPNGRIPAIVDHEAGDFPVFESGAIMIYLAEKAGALMPSDAKGRSRVIQWVMFQMGGVGPMMGQSGHFLGNAPGERIEYAIKRYGNEVKRLHGVMDKRLADARYFAGDEYSIADMAIWPWLRGSERHGVVWTEYPNVKRWFDEIAARPAVKRGIQVLADMQTTSGQYDEKARAVLFGNEQFQRR